MEESAQIHERVSQRWTAAAVTELNEAKDFGEVAEQVCVCMYVCMYVCRIT
jgi:hypothetical protein